MAKIVGWIVRTGASGAYRLWNVGDPSPDKALAVAADAAKDPEAWVSGPITDNADPEFSVKNGVAIEWVRSVK